MKPRRRILPLLCLLVLFLPGAAAAFSLIDNYSMKDISPQRAGFTYIKAIVTLRDIVYFGTANGLVVFDGGKNSWSVLHKDNTPLPSNFIVALAVDYNNNHVWLATAEGVARYVPGEKDPTRRWTVFRKQDGLADNETTAIAVDDEYVWVGTRYWGVSRYEKALNRWRARPFTPIDGLGANRINGLIVDGKQVWAATDDGLSLYDRYTELWSNFDAKQGLSAKQVTCLASDGKGIWAGTYGGGLNYFDKDTLKFKVYGTADGLVDDTVFSVAGDGTSVWVGTFGGVSRYVKGEAIPWKNYNKGSHKLIDNAVTAIGVHGNRIWFGTDGEGISLFDKKTPQIVITDDTGYVKKGELGVFALIQDSYPIVSCRVLHRPSLFPTQAPSAAGVTLLNESSIKDRKLVQNIQIAKIDLTGMRDNFTYDLIVETVNSRGDRNSAIFLFTVDTTAPILTISEMPEAVKDRDIFIRGSCIEFYLSRIEVSVNKGRYEPVDEIDRKARTFSHKLSLNPGDNTVSVRVFDLGKNSATMEKKIYYDPDKPVFILDDSVKQGVASTPEFTIKGKVREAGLASLVLMPAKLRIPWKKEDTDLWSFEIKVPLVKGTNGFSLVAMDQAGSRESVDLVINYNTEAPTIAFAADLPRETGSRFFTVKGTWDDKDLKEIVITPGNVVATIDPKTKTFWAKINLENDFTIIKATALDEEGNKNTISTSVTFNTRLGGGTGDTPMQDAKENYRLYLQYKKQYDELLARYKVLLLKYEELEKRCASQAGTGKGTPGGGPFIPPGLSVFFAPYSRQDGDTMESLAQRYLNDPAARQMIAGFNNNNPAAQAKDKGRLLIPTAELIRHLYSASHRADAWGLIDLVAEAFGAAGPGGSFYGYRQAIVQALRRRGLFRAADPPDNLFDLRGGSILQLHAGGSLDGAIQNVRLRMIAKKAHFGYIVTFHGSYIRFFRVEL